jgi:pimeloyl-ACP methyl ester carboxylesterase
VIRGGHLVDDGHRIPTRVGKLAVRVRGDGPASSDPGHRFSLDDCAAAAGEVLTTLDIVAPVDWVGNAWGGHVGIVFAATWPDRCRTLITFGTPVQAYGRSERLMLRSLLGVYRVTGMADFLSSQIRDALLSTRTRSSDPEAVALVLDSLRTLDRRAFANAMVSISLERRDLSPRLPSIRCPTVFVTGADHPEWTGNQAEAASRTLAIGSAAVIPGAAYLIPLEAPDATIQHVRDLWAH